MIAYVTSAVRWTAGWIVISLWSVMLVIGAMFVPMRRLRGFARVGFGLLLSAVGLKIVVRGTEGLDPNKGYLYMSNHVNLLEPFIATLAFPGWTVALEKKENFKLPFYGALIRSWGNIAIDRNNFQSALKSLERCKETLQSGVSIQVMPEGTRSRNGRLGPFKKGGFHMAIDAGATIVPYAYKGLDQFLRTGSLVIRPTTIEVIFTAPIEASEYTKDTMQELSDRVRSQILAALGQTDEVAAEQAVGAGSQKL